MYIRSSSCISLQDSFNNPGFSSRLIDEESIQYIAHPNYSEFVSIMEMRRMSESVKMSIACSKLILQDLNDSDLDGIIIGTSMGSSIHTKKFLDNIIDSHGGILSPTAFISSTHNTIAGQLSILLNCNGYNMTHTQSNLSFEYALIDAILMSKESVGNYLLGGADESENTLFNMKARFNSESIRSSSGAGFFVLSGRRENAKVKVTNTFTFSHSIGKSASLVDILKLSYITINSTDLILLADSTNNDLVDIPSHQIQEYQKYSGTYFTNSAFALHLAIDFLVNNPNVITDRIIIVNNIISTNIGVIIVEPAI